MVDWNRVNKLFELNVRDRYKAMKKMTLEEKLDIGKLMNLDDLKQYNKLLDHDMKHPKPKYQVEPCNDLIDDIIKQIFIELKVKKRTEEFKIYPDLNKYVLYQAMRDLDAGVYDNKELTEADITRYLIG